MATAAQTMIAGLGGLGTEVQKELDQEQRDREAELSPPIRVNLSDITNYLYLAFRKDSRMKPVPTHVVIQGTVERVTAPDQYSKAFNVYFKENAKHEFAFCTYEADTFQDVFGADFMTKLAGKTVEIEGWVDMACAVRAGIRVALAHQLRVIGPGVAPAVAKVWSAADYEIPPTRSATPVPASPSIRPAQRQANQENSARPQATPLAPSAQPAPAPKGPAEAVAPVTQTTAVRSVPQTTAPAQAAVSPAQASDLGLDDVIQLVKGGMAEQLVIKSIQNSNQTYRIGPAELLKLQNAGVSQRIIEALLETNKKPGAANAPPALAATPAAPAPAAAQLL
jgi:hypothetical protein